MFIAAWSFDIQWGRREETLKALNKFRPEANKGWRGKGTRILLGSIGAPESRVVVEHLFASLADLEAGWEDLHRQPEMFREWVGAMKDNVVPGSPRWEIYRVLENP